MFVLQNNMFVLQNNMFVLQNNMFVLENNMFVLENNMFVLQNNMFVLENNMFVMFNILQKVAGITITLLSKMKTLSVIATHLPILNKLSFYIKVCLLYKMVIANVHVEPSL